MIQNHQPKAESTAGPASVKQASSGGEGVGNRRHSPQEAQQRQENPGALDSRASGGLSARRFMLWYLLVVTPTIYWVVIVSSSPIVRAEQALARRDHRQALTLASQELKSSPRFDRALLVAGAACLAERDFLTAQLYLKNVSNHRREIFGIAQGKLAQIATVTGHWKEAEESFRVSTALAPPDPENIDKLIYLLTLEGRNWEARELALRQLKTGIVTTNYLFLLGAVRPTLEADEAIASRCLASVPNDPMPRMLIARKLWRDNQPEDAKTQLKILLQKYPDLLEAHALLLQILAETGTSDEFLAAHSRLPQEADTHPGVWLSRGIWAENHNQLPAAARCQWEAVKLDPDLADANYRLSRNLAALQRTEDAVRFGLRSDSISKLSRALDSFTKQVDYEKVPDIVDRLLLLGRDWEAAGWCQILAQEQGRRPLWARKCAQQVYPRLISFADSAGSTKGLDRSVDLSNYPLPDFFRDRSDSPDPRIPIESNSSISFRNDSARAGLDFTYRNGASNDDWECLLEMDGGGVAVLDYDSDGWPDIYFTQGGVLPPAPFDSTINDRLFRNRAATEPGALSREFQDVTNFSGLVDAGYGQGVTVGDFDNDGFPDLYIGNIGQNQFFRNNGDGTFQELAGLVKTGTDVWTSSVVLADFNNDSLPDLYVVTYLAGKNPYKRCLKRGRERCAPLLNPAEPDLFYLNLGDGDFRDQTNCCGLDAPDGRGLGVVAADFDGTNRLSIFVANDMSANFFFRNQTVAPATLKFEEQGLLSGLAFDHLGRAKACMGVAAGDYNRDGLLDLVVTNFYRESNDVYTQQTDGSFRDLSRETGIFDPSFLKVGWGTQFLDADLDGNLDLIVSNAHVHEPLEQEGGLYDMEPQFFQNRNRAKFVELKPQQLGDYFQHRWFGRSLARLDWNRDGREDACISHLNQPVALLTNQTTNPGHFMAVRLVAVDSARDAIGTKVKVTAGRETWTSQLTAGDGFQASNQRQLIFGLGEQNHAEKIEVDWPSGTHQEFQQVEIDREWLLIEHHPLVQMMVNVR